MTCCAIEECFLDPNVTEIFGAYPVQGVWNPASPSQTDILYQVCQASSCN